MGKRMRARILVLGPLAMSHEEEEKCIRHIHSHQLSYLFVYLGNGGPMEVAQRRVVVMMMVICCCP